jgi:hypothetical protein
MNNTLEEANTVFLNLKFTLEQDDKCEIKLLDFTLLKQH